MNKAVEAEFIDGDAPLENLDIDTSDFVDEETDPLALPKKGGRASRLNDDDEDDGDDTGGGSSRRSSSNDEVERLRQEVIESRQAAERERNERLAAEERAGKASAEKIETEKAFVSSRIHGLTHELKDIEAQLVRAKEDGNTAEEVKLQRQLTERSSELAQAKTVQEELKAVKAPEKKAETTTNNNDSKIPPAAQDWIERNRWYKDVLDGKSSNQKDYDRRGKADFAYKKVLEEGKYKPDQPEFYKEIDRRLAVNNDNNKGNGRRSPVASVSEGNNPPERSNGKVRVQLDAADRAAMVALKMNPRDPKAMALYASEKLGVEEYDDEAKPLNIDMYKRALRPTKTQ